MFWFSISVVNSTLTWLQREWPQRLLSENVIESANELKEFATVDDVIKQMQIEVCIFLYYCI